MGFASAELYNWAQMNPTNASVFWLVFLLVKATNSDLFIPLYCDCPLAIYFHIRQPLIHIVGLWPPPPPRKQAIVQMLLETSCCVVFQDKLSVIVCAKFGGQKSVPVVGNVEVANA